MSALADSPLIDLAAGMTRGWTALYTWRLPEDLRDTRRAEIESDLWEHLRLAMLVEEPVYVTALGIILRFLLGLPADLTWRMESRALHRSRVATTESGLVRWAFRGAHVVAAIPLLMAAFISCYSLVSATAESNIWYGMFAILTLLTTATTIWGLRISANCQPLGIRLTAGGSLTFVLAWILWFPVMVTIPTSVGLIVLSYFRGKRAGWRADTRSDTAA